jgi:hypothetical protein
MSRLRGDGTEPELLLVVGGVILFDDCDGRFFEIVIQTVEGENFSVELAAWACHVFHSLLELSVGDSLTLNYTLKYGGV